MTRIEVELFTDQGNDAVLKLPERKFPGVLIQGDTLSTLVETARDALQALGRGDAVDAESLVQALSVRLQEAQLRYEAALRTQGQPLPY